MDKKVKIKLDEGLKERTNLFYKNIKSRMKYKSDIDSMLNQLEWLEKIEFAIPYIDNIVRNPKVTLITQAETEKIEKAKKIGVESIRDLAKHTDYIEKVEKTGVKPSKILSLYREETYNLYENRLVYTLINDITFYITKKEEELNKLNTKKHKELQYFSTTNNGAESIEIEMKITTGELRKSKEDSQTHLKKEINEILKRIKRVKTLLSIWRKSDMMKTLKKMNVPSVMTPINKTNVLIKNPNYKNATELFLYLKSKIEQEEEEAQSYITGGNSVILNLLNDAFLEDFCVVDSISSSATKQKEQLTEYMLILLTHQVKRIVEILLKNGVKITEEELLKLISIEKNDDKAKTEVDKDIKKKFIKEIDDYLSKIQEGL